MIFNALKKQKQSRDIYLLLEKKIKHRCFKTMLSARQMELDTKTLIHVAAEFLVIGGTGFWLNKKISTLTQKVEILEERIDSYENVFKSIAEGLNKHERMLQSLTGPIRPPQPSSAPVYRQPISQPKSSPDSNPSKHSKNQPIELPEEQIQILEEEDISDQELDEMINKELENTDMFGDDDRTDLKSEDENKKKN